MSAPIEVELRHGGAALWITLARPKANVLDEAMIGAITAAVREHATHPALRVIVFEGAGAHFSFGASVEEHRAEKVASMLERFGGLFWTLGELSVPTAAIVRGQCLGGGLELASYCTWLFASPDARLGQPEIQLAVFPPLASVILPWRVGGGAAMDLCVSGRSIGADEAHRLGLVSRIADDPAAAFAALIEERLAGLSASSLRYAERAARVSLANALERDLPRLERMYVNELMKTADANEGIEAFLEKRSPTYGRPR